MTACDWGQTLPALYWLSPVATSFQQDRFWWGDKEVLIFSHLLFSEPEHLCCRPDLQGSQLSVADERLVPICPATSTCFKINSGLLLFKCNLLLWTRHLAKCLLFLWELCPALQCCDCARQVFLWLASSSCFLTFLFCLKFILHKWSSGLCLQELPEAAMCYLANRVTDLGRCSWGTGRQVGADVMSELVQLGPFLAGP